MPCGIRRGVAWGNYVYSVFGNRWVRWSEVEVCGNLYCDKSLQLAHRIRLVNL